MSCHFVLFQIGPGRHVVFYSFLHVGVLRVTWAPDESLLKTESISEHAVHWNKSILQTCFSTGLVKCMLQCKISILIWLVWSKVTSPLVSWHTIVLSFYLQNACQVWRPVEIHLQQRPCMLLVEGLGTWGCSDRLVILCVRSNGILWKGSIFSPILYNSVCFCITTQNKIRIL